MNTLNKIKLYTGILLIVLSIIGCIPIISSIDFFGGSSKSYSSVYKDPFDIMNDETTTTVSKNISETSYPFLVGLFALSGTLLIISIKKNNKD